LYLEAVVLSLLLFTLYFNDMKIKTAEVEKYKTILIIVIGMLAIHIITKYNWALYTALIVGLSGAFSEFLAGIINTVWLKIGMLLSYIVPNIILTIVFYVFLTPIAFLSRIFGEKNQLNLKNTEKSIFKVRNTLYSIESFENPW
jgi:hypothetical protein